MKGIRQLQHTPNFDSIPTLAERNGILPVTVVNPLTGAVYPAGTQIPIASINPFAAAVLNALPAPNTGSATSISNNYQTLLLYRDYSDKYDAKLDGQINDRMSMFLRWSQRKDIYYQQSSMPGFAGGDGNGFIHSIQQNASWATPGPSMPARFWKYVSDLRTSWPGKQPPLHRRSEPGRSLRHSGPSHYVPTSPAD